MMNYDRNELIDKYISGEWSAEERILFTDLYNTDASFKTSADQRKVLIDALKAHNKRNELKALLEGFHAEIDSHEARKYKTKFTNRIIRFVQVQKHNFAVASSVAIIAIASTFAMTTKYFSDKRMGEYQELNQEIRDIKGYQDQILKSLKSNNSNKSNYHPGKFNGTAFAISQDGYLVTSSHLIRTADSIVIQNGNGLRWKVEPIYRNTAYDLAIVKIVDENFSGFGKLPYGLSDNEASLGEKIFTLGFPRADLVYGEGSLSASSGYMGDTTSYQVSVPVNPGNSGGPLLDSKGNLIGVISGKQTASEGVAFAVKASYIQQLLMELPELEEQPQWIGKHSSVNGLNRPKQVQKIADFVFEVNVYND